MAEQINVLQPQRVSLVQLIHLVRELNDAWVPLTGQCCLLKKPYGDFPPWMWSLIIVEYVETDVRLNPAEQVYAIDAFKHFYQH